MKYNIDHGTLSVISDLTLVTGFSLSLVMNVSNKEQLTMYIRWVDKHQNPHEDFLGFSNIPDISAETIVTAVTQQKL